MCNQTCKDIGCSAGCGEVPSDMVQVPKAEYELLKAQKAELLEEVNDLFINHGQYMTIREQAYTRLLLEKYGVKS